MSAPDDANYRPKILLAQRGMSIHVANFLDSYASLKLAGSFGPEIKDELDLSEIRRVGVVAYHVLCRAFCSR